MTAGDCIDVDDNARTIVSSTDRTCRTTTRGSDYLGNGSAHRSPLNSPAHGNDSLMPPSRRLAILGLMMLWAAPALAGPQGPRRQPADLDGPPSPVAPAVITRDDKGGATIRAVRIDKPLKIDGQLDEEV